MMASPSNSSSSKHRSRVANLPGLIVPTITYLPDDPPRFPNGSNRSNFGSMEKTDKGMKKTDKSLQRLPDLVPPMEMQADYDALFPLGKPDSPAVASSRVSGSRIRDTRDSEKPRRRKSPVNCNDELYPKPFGRPRRPDWLGPHHYSLLAHPRQEKSLMSLEHVRPCLQCTAKGMSCSLMLRHRGKDVECQRCVRARANASGREAEDMAPCIQLRISYDRGWPHTRKPARHLGWATITTVDNPAPGAPGSWWWSRANPDNRWEPYVRGRRLWEDEEWSGTERLMLLAEELRRVQPSKIAVGMGVAGHDDRLANTRRGFSLPSWQRDLPRVYLGRDEGGAGEDSGTDGKDKEGTTPQSERRQAAAAALDSRAQPSSGPHQRQSARAEPKSENAAEQTVFNIHWSEVLPTHGHRIRQAQRDIREKWAEIRALEAALAEDKKQKSQDKKQKSQDKK